MLCSRIQYWIMRFVGPTVILMTHLVLLSIGAEKIYVPCWRLFSSHVGSVTATWIILVFVAPNAMIMISLALTIFGDPGRSDLSMKRMLKEGMVDRSFFDQFPRCAKCGLPKPPRCHHCRTCNHCHLKMDHHCPAVGICIALRNQRPFLAMFRWAELSCIMNACLGFFRCSFGEDSIFAAMIAILLVMLAIIFHVFWNDSATRIERNVTTIEEMYSDDLTKYDLGTNENWKQVFGSHSFGEYIPQKSKMTGFEWTHGLFRNHANP